MNWLDIIILIPLLWAIYRGWRSGILVQAGMLAGLAAGILVSWLIGAKMVEWLEVTDPAGKVVVYIVLAGVALLAVVLVARLVGAAFTAVGLGVVDKAGGAALSLLKMGVVVSVALCLLGWANDRREFLPQSALDASALYAPMLKLTSYAFPYIEATRDRIFDIAEPETEPAPEN